MEHTAEQAIATTDQDWADARKEVLNCADFDVQSVVDHVLDRWKSASIGYRAMAYAEIDGQKRRTLARTLREAEQTLGAAMFRLNRAGYGGRIMELVKALLQCRMLIVLPVAKRMAERDEMTRSPDKIAWLLVQRAPFIDGRAVIDQSLASELPSPYKTEPPSA